MNNILSLGARAACVLLFTGATACAGSDGPTDPANTGESADELSVSRSSFITLRPDLRKCMAPLCGGYWVRDVNRQGAERYVSGLEFSPSRLPEDAIEDVRSAPANELVLHGYLGTPDSRFNTRPFVVLEAFRGMPGITAAENAFFFQVHARNPPNACFVAPCPNEIGSLLNTTNELEFDRVSVDKASVVFLDKGWLSSRVLSHNAVAAGVFVQGDRFPGGYEKVLDASQVFVRLPDRAGPCTARPTLRCQDGMVSAYDWTDDRCIVQVACVEQGVCPQYRLMCAEGYTLTSWTAPLSGCPAYACDPTFIVW